MPSTPPHILSEMLAFVLAIPERAAELIEMRTRGPNNKLEDKITLLAAYQKARNGEIEAVGTKGDPLRYVRKLAKPVDIDVHPKGPIVFPSSSTAIARLNMGAYKQPLLEVFTDEHGNVIDEGESRGWVYSHCACREFDGAIEKLAA